MTESLIARKKLWIIGVLAAMAMMLVMLFTLASPASADFCIDEGKANVENVGPSPSGFGDDDGVAMSHGAAWRAHQNSDAIDNGCST